MNGVVEAVSQSPKHGFSKQPRMWIRLLPDQGVEGDAHRGNLVQHRSRVARDPTQPNLRQVHLVHRELLEELAPRALSSGPAISVRTFLPAASIFSDFRPTRSCGSARPLNFA